MKTASKQSETNVLSTLKKIKSKKKSAGQGKHSSPCMTDRQEIEIIFTEKMEIEIGDCNQCFTGFFPQNILHSPCLQRSN